MNLAKKWIESTNQQLLNNCSADTTNYMRKHIEIECPGAYDTYNGKRLLFVRMAWGHPVLTIGKFLVGGNSKWIDIDWTVGIIGGRLVHEHIPVSQETYQNIQPAFQNVLDDFEGYIHFVIQKPIRADYSS